MILLAAIIFQYFHNLLDILIIILFFITYISIIWCKQKKYKSIQFKEKLLLNPILI